MKTHIYLSLFICLLVAWGCKKTKSNNATTAITSFIFSSTPVPVTGSIQGDTISLNLEGMNPTQHAPAIVLQNSSEQISPKSLTVQDFSSVVTYKVTAGNGTKQLYYANATFTPSIKTTPTTPKALCRIN